MTPKLYTSPSSVNSFSGALYPADKGHGLLESKNLVIPYSLINASSLSLSKMFDSFKFPCGIISS
ncbi:unnamed protein product [Rhodiola kirilowii]